MKERIPSLSIGAFQGTYGDNDAINRLADIGITAVDFSTASKRYDYRSSSSIYSKGEAAVVEYFEKIKETADRRGVTVCQTHGRITGFTGDREHDDALIRNARVDILAAKALGAPVSVMHAVTTIHMGIDCPAEVYHRLNYDMFCRILEIAAKEDLIIATETFGDALGICDFFGNIDEFEESYRRVCDKGYADHFKICVDTGHSNKAMRFGNPTPADVIRRLGKDTVCLHLNDNDSLTDQHKIPCTGIRDWNDVFCALDEVGYNGYYNMELNLNKYFGKDFIEEEASFAVKVMKNLLKDRYGV